MQSLQGREKEHPLTERVYLAWATDARSGAGEATATVALRSAREAKGCVSTADEAGIYGGAATVILTCGVAGTVTVTCGAAGTESESESANASPQVIVTSFVEAETHCESVIGPCGWSREAGETATSTESVTRSGCTSASESVAVGETASDEVSEIVTDVAASVSGNASGNVSPPCGVCPRCVARQCRPTAVAPCS
jgi:hypothetical protein